MPKENDLVDISTYCMSFTKRIFDLSVAILGILFLIPLLPFIFLSIKCTSKGPCLYKQVRIGMDNVPFTVIKFRTMVVTNNKNFDKHNVTKVGSVLRKVHLDEFPQFINVILGQMSIVGPRPLVVHEVNEFSQRISQFRFRHLIKPGVTGLAQINYVHHNSIESIEAKLIFDLEYIQHGSLKLDLQITLKTIKEAFRVRGV